MCDCPIRSHNCLDPAINLSVLCQHKYLCSYIIKKLICQYYLYILLKQPKSKVRPTEISWFKRTPTKFKKKDKNLESKWISQWPNNWFTSPMMINKIIPSVDYNWCLKHFDTKLNESTNQNSIYCLGLGMFWSNFLISLASKYKWERFLVSTIRRGANI